MTTARVLFVSGVLGVVAGCSFLLDVEGPLPTIPAPDDASAEGGGEGFADGAAPDAFAEDPLEASTGFCALAGTVRFCDDFGRPGGDAGGDWLVRLASGGSLAVEADGTSGGFLRARLTASPETGRAALARSFEATPQTRLRMTSHLRFTTRPASVVSTASVVLGPLPGAHAFTLLAGPDTFTLLEQALPGGAVVEHPLAIAVPLGRFVELEVRLGLDVSPPNLDVILDGQTALSVPSMQGTTTGVPSVVVGIGEATPSPAWEVDVDDVVVDFE